MNHYPCWVIWLSWESILLMYIMPKQSIGSQSWTLGLSILWSVIASLSEMGICSQFPRDSDTQGDKRGIMTVRFKLSYLLDFHILSLSIRTCLEMNPKLMILKPCFYYWNSVCIVGGLINSIKQWRSSVTTSLLPKVWLVVLPSFFSYSEVYPSSPITQQG